MGSESIDDRASHRAYYEVFDEVFPYMLEIGMSPVQFWDGDPWLAKAYIDADEIRKKRKNEELWLQGFYVYNAIASFAEILPAFPRKGAKVQPYLEEPVPLTEAEVIAKKEREAREKFEAMKGRMMEMARTVNKQKEVKNDE